MLQQPIEITLIVECPHGGDPSGGGALLAVVPRAGDYLAHERAKGDNRLYRVLAVVVPTNPDADSSQTFDVHVADEGPHHEALPRVLRALAAKD